MRRSLALLWVAAAALAACGGARPAPALSAPPAAALSPSLPPSPSPALPVQPSFTPLPQTITLTGAVEARLDAARVGSPCGQIGDAYGFTMRFVAAGTEYAMDVVVAGYSGPQAYPVPPVRASLHTLTLGPGARLYAGVRGTVTPAADGRGGSLDLDLAGDGGSVHAAGDWRCPPR